MRSDALADRTSDRRRCGHPRRNPTAHRACRCTVRASRAVRSAHGDAQPSGRRGAAHSSVGRVSSLAPSAYRAAAARGWVRPAIADDARCVAGTVHVGESSVRVFGGRHRGCGIGFFEASSAPKSRPGWMSPSTMRARALFTRRAAHCDGSLALRDLVCPGTGARTRGAGRVEARAESGARGHG